MMDNFDDGGEKNPPKGSLKKQHKIPTSSKRKFRKNKEG